MSQQEEASERREVFCRSYSLHRQTECKAGAILYTVFSTHLYHVTNKLVNILLDAGVTLRLQETCINSLIYMKVQFVLMVINYLPEISKS